MPSMLGVFRRRRTSRALPTMPGSGGGASMTSEIAIAAAEPRVTTQRRHRSPLFPLLGLVTIPILILDQASKLYVSAHMSLYESIPVIPNWFDITYTRNPGAAFSMFTNLPAWFRGAFLATLASVAIV